MAITALWSGLLALAFLAVVVVASEDLSGIRALVYLLLSFFLGLLSFRTGYELVRRLRA